MLNCPVPPNLLEGKFLQFAADNIDIIEETLDAKGTFHATPKRKANRSKWTTITSWKRRLPQNTGGAIKQLNHAPEATARPTPRFVVDVDLESYATDPILTTTANIKDICWLLTRHYRTPDQSVPAWMGFNQLTIINKQQVKFVSYPPIISSREEAVICWYL